MSQLALGLPGMVTIPPHPARFSHSVLAVLRSEALVEGARLGRPLVILDPFAGTGRVHWLRADGHQTVGIELEPEWAAARHGTVAGDARRLPLPAQSVDAIATSPCYGNRLADHHEAKDGSLRRSYRHDLGRPLSPGSAAGLQWGDRYRAFHQEAIAEMVRVLRPGGLLALNMSDHVRDGATVPVVAWWRQALEAAGVVISEDREVPTRRFRYGSNRDRVEVEHVLVRRS